MRSRFSVILTLIAAFSLGGCQLLGGGGGDEVAQEDAPAPAPAVVDPAAPPTDTEAAPVAELPPVVVPAGPAPLGDLIQSTDPQARVSGVSLGDRSDPFANLPIRPPTPPTPAVSPGGANQPGTLPGNNQPPGGVNQPGGIRPGPVGPPTGTLPTIPTPEVATTIVVTGVVQVGSEVYAIIDGTDGSPSRYVQEGQYLAGGRVLVKRIEVRQSGEPIVILEENGIEVARRVGEGLAEETA